MHALLSGQPGERRLLSGQRSHCPGRAGGRGGLCHRVSRHAVSEIGDRFYQIPQETDLYFEYSTNEKVALEVAAGAAASGLRTMCP